MTILILYTRNQGYLSQFFEEVSIRLAQESHQVYNFSLKSRMYEENENHVLLTVEKKGGYIKNYYEIFKIIKSVKPDVILSNFSYVNPALLFGKLYGIKNNMVWFHSLNQQTQATSLNIWIKSMFLKLADVVIANSHHTKEELHKAFKVPKAKIKTIPFWSPILTKTPNLKKGEPNDKNKIKIGCPGRFIEHKNQKIIIDTLALFKASNFELHLAGTGPNKDFLIKQAEELHVLPKVVFRGHLSASEMIDFYLNMDLIVLPSLAEAFGLVFIEAISMGTPVIVSSQFGALTFIKDKDAIHKISFNPKFVNSLKLKLEPYFNNKGLSSSYFKNLYLTNFDKESINKQVQQLILRNEIK